jgi:hypothetical protein
MSSTLHLPPSRRKSECGAKKIDSGRVRGNAFDSFADATVTVVTIVPLVCSGITDFPIDNVVSRRDGLWYILCICCGTHSHDSNKGSSDLFFSLFGFTSFDLSVLLCPLKEVLNRPGFAGDLSFVVLAKVGAKHLLTTLAPAPAAVSIFAKRPDVAVAAMFTDMVYPADLRKSVVSTVALDLAAYRRQWYCKPLSDKTQPHSLIQVLFNLAALLKIEMTVVHLF